MGKQVRVTLEQIARQAGCSVTVVSKTLNRSRGNAGVGEEMRRSVLRIAEELGYTPNYHARALQQGRARTLGLVCRLSGVQRLDIDFWGQLIQGVERMTRTAHHDLLIIGPTEEMDEIDHGIEYLRQRRIDVLIVPTPIYHQLVPRLANLDYPIVLAAGPEQQDLPGIELDVRPGIRQAFAHLTELGHRKALWIPTVRSGEIEEPKRHCVLLECAAEFAVELNVLPVTSAAWTPDASVGGFVEDYRRQIVGRMRPEALPGAVIAYNERVAMGVYAAAAEWGLHVPQDLSVIGFDDIYAHVTLPPMTVVSIQLPAMGERAAQLAIEIANSPQPISDYRSHSERIPSELVIRASTAPPHSP